MLTVKYIFVVTSIFIQGVVSGGEEKDTEKPILLPVPDYVGYDIHYDHYHDHADHYIDKPYFGDYGAYDDYVHESSKDYGTYDYVWDYGEYPDYPFVDYYGAAGDRDNPVDTLPHDHHAHDETGVLGQLPWVFIIMPMVQVDVYYLNNDRSAIEDIELQLPVETYLFELGDFGMGHLDLGNWGMDHYGDYYNDYAEYDYMADYADYGHYPPPAQLYDTGDQLDDKTTLDYPGIDHDFWVDWIFMVPPDMGPVR